jgi:HEAT repeat protein
VSAVAARVLGEIDRDSTVALFSRRLHKTGPFLRDEAGVREAITILGEMEAPEAVPALSRILNRGFWIPFSTGDALRSQAARALRRIGTSDAMAAIEKATRSARRSVRDICESLRASAPAVAEQTLPPAAGASR